ncbi:MAG: thioredoxin family protein [Candidatus Eisenbacteria bacterium]
MTDDVGDFETEVIARSHTIPVLVDFWAEWCGPCRLLGPVLEKMAGEAAGRWTLAKVDTEALPEVAQRYDVTSIPNVKLFVNGEVTDEFVGALPESEVRRWLARAIPSPHAAELAIALRHLADGEAAVAAPVLAAILATEPDNAAARLALGEAQLQLAPETVPALIAPLADDPERAERVEALGVLAALASEPHPGVALAPIADAVRRRDWDQVLGGCVALVGDRRSPQRERAREIGRAVIMWLGIEHPIVERHFRAFSSALHA